MEQKKFGFWTILALAFGSIIGTGIFTGAALGANFSGNMVIIAWILLSILGVYIAACFGELAAAFPKSGGVYEYGKQAYGRFISFIMGWMAWLTGTISIALLVVTAINFLMPSESSFLIKVGFSAVIVVLLNFITFIGVEMSSYALLAFAAVMIAVMAAVIIRGISEISISNFIPFFTNDFSTIFVAVFFMAESYFGWEAASYLAEETSNPRRVIPKALIIGTLMVAFFGLLMMVVMLGVVPHQQLAELCHPNSASCDPITPVLKMLFGEFGAVLIVGIVLMMVGSAAAGIISLPRLLLALSRDRLMLGNFRHLHPIFGTPHNAIIFQSIALILVLIAGFAHYQTLLGILVPLALIMYILSLLTLSVLREIKPGIERPFKAPFGEAGPIIVSLIFLAVMVFWILTVSGSMQLLMLGLSIALFGIPLYFLIEMYYDPKMISSVNDIFSYLTLATEHFTFPRGVRKEILDFLGDINGKTVLEYGCSVGTLTIPLAEAVGTKGRIYATHFSEHDLKIVRRRLINKKWETEKRIYGQVKLVHDLEHFVRLHPDVRYADAAVSVGMLSYIQEPKKVAQEISSVLPAGGKICFVEYGDFFHIIPNKEWISDDKRIIKVFREAGLSVQVTRKKGLLWSYIFIFGVKSGKGIAYI